MHRKLLLNFAAVLAAVTLWLLPLPSAADTLRLGGTGMALGPMRELANALSARDSAFQAEVLPSLGSGGGILALAKGAIDVAVAARPLTPAEVQNGLRIAACTRTPFVLATSLTTPQRARKSDIAALFADPAAAWPDGTPVRIVLRTRDDADNTFLIEHFPGMQAALENARQRPDVPLATSDQHNAELAQKIAGSLTSMTLMQIASERLTLRAITIDGVTPSAAALEDKS